MDFLKIKEIIKEESLLRFFYDEDYDIFLESYGDYTPMKEFENKEEAIEFIDGLGLGNFVQVDYRCDTSKFYSITHFKDYNIFVKITGWYDSYGGGEHTYDEITQVFPKTISKIIYE